MIVVPQFSCNFDVVVGEVLSILFKSSSEDIFFIALIERRKERKTNIDTRKKY